MDESEYSNPNISIDKFKKVFSFLMNNNYNCWKKLITLDYHEFINNV
jgi:hypothetical protein